VNQPLNEVEIDAVQKILKSRVPESEKIAAIRDEMTGFQIETEEIVIKDNGQKAQITIVCDDGSRPIVNVGT
jgi:hypothetical protein